MDCSSDIEAVTEGKRKMKKRVGGLAYMINETPPWYLCILLGFQHYLTMLGANLAVPLALRKYMCFETNDLALSEVIATVFFTSGIATLLQTTFGVRLPIVQGSTFTFIAPATAILTLDKFKCPEPSSNATLGANETAIDMNEIWKPRMLEIQGAIMVASLFQVLIGVTGLMGVLLRFIGPVAIAPTITLIGLALFEVAAYHSAKQWGVAIMTVVLIALFSQYLQNIKIPFPGYSKERGCHMNFYPVFRLFPIILAICVSWMVCAIVTAADGLPVGNAGRTDTKVGTLQKAKWFRVPYPGQWGLPTVSVAGVFGMLAGVIASIVESVGDYYACARMCGAPPPPTHAINRGIGIEGLGCIITGAWGTGSGTTSYSENIGAIGITKVGSLRVIQFGALVALVMGVVGKVGALFTTIPDPIVGGVFLVMFGMITAVGISNLQYVDMTSARNMFIVGVSIVAGMAIPFSLKAMFEADKNLIQTGSMEVDQIIKVLLTTNIAVGGLIALFLDNTIPGTAKERGITAWRKRGSGKEGGEDEDFQVAPIHVYDLPCCLKSLGYKPFAKYVPFLPYYPPESNTDGATNVAIVMEPIPDEKHDGKAEVEGAKLDGKLDDGKDDVRSDEKLDAVDAADDKNNSDASGVKEEEKVDADITAF
ncbi:predicted protein [Nematostella vectensis]|uniref:Solute carrier family 23 member 2 n=1 Tax=Nematostella vectensis TaxID=45351 RepID=A7RXI6_NEMVE|nr:predicted protein [Nematostella vectensis]|eukprot:XP_001635843.1 predicted protein [Nematostella vectensis]